MCLDLYTDETSCSSSYRRRKREGKERKREREGKERKREKEGERDGERCGRLLITSTNQQ